MTIHAFNFHQLVGVQIESNDPAFNHFFEAEYHPYAAPFSEEINKVTLKWRRSDWPFVSGHHFHMHKCLARWSYRVLMHEHRVDIEAIGNRTAIPMIHHMLVHPSIRYLCAQNDILMLHGSAVVLNNTSLVFTGVGGAGKTTVSSLLLDHGGKEWLLHADDYIFLKEGPISFSYMTRSHLYRDQVRWVPALQSVLSRRERLHLEFFGRLRELTKERIKWPLRVEPSRLWSDHAIAPRAHVGAILILDRGHADHLCLEKIDVPEKTMQELLHMNFFEARHFIMLIQRTLGEAGMKDWLKNWREKERALLHKILRQTSLYRLELPSKGTDVGRFGRELVDILKSLIDLGKGAGSNG